MWLTRLALRNPVFILMMSLAVLALGWVSLTRLSVDLFPTIDVPNIRVATFYTGAGPVDVEKSITMPIERAVSASPGVDWVESTSKQGFSSVSVFFQYGTNLDNAQFEVSQRVAQIMNTLPPGIQQPFILKFDVTNIPVVNVAMSAEGLDEKQLYDLAYNTIEPQIERIKGVASATVAGGKIREIEVKVQPGANTVAVVDAVRAALPKLRGVPPNVELAVSFDQSAYIRAAISSLEHEAVQGGVLAVLVILLFLVSFSATGIIAVAIPLSIVATFVLLYFTGQTLNVFTLGGLALGVGRLVDDSIVELENIHRHLAMGQDRREAVLNAAQEVAMPIFVSTITTIVVFFPVVFLVGVAKNLFLPLALTIAFALIMSFFVSRTVTPLLCLRHLRAEGHEATARGLGGHVTRTLERLDDAYAGALAWVLRNRLKVIAV